MGPMRTPALLLAAVLAAALPASGRADGGATTLRTRPRAGIAYHPQLAAPGLAVGAGVALDLARFGPDGHGGGVSVGLAAEHLRFSYRQVDVPVGASHRTDLETTLSLTPILVELEARVPLAGRLAGYGGAGAGAVLTRVETVDVRADLPVRGEGSALAPAAALHAGVGIGLGPGRFTVEARFHIGRGEVEGAARGLWAGGFSGTAGYELDF